jgi:uracil-DNA glycosylase
MIDAERRAALELVAGEVRSCRRCRLHEGRTQAVPGEGHPATEVVFVGEGPGLNEDRQGRPFVGRAGDLLVELLGSIGWRREDVFITNIVKCRPPDNRDPAPDEIAACLPFLRRQLEILDPALVVALGRHSLGRFMPGTTISRVHGTVRPADPASGAPNALALAMYHPAAALRSPALDEACRADVRQVPRALEEARARREAVRAAVQAGAPGAAAAAPPPPVPPGAPPATAGASDAPPATPDASQSPGTPPASGPLAPPPVDELPAADQLTLF